MNTPKHTRPRLRAFALVGSLALAVASAHAYEPDTHFLMTLAVCRASGLSNEDATTVARYDEGMDDSEAVSATSASTIPLPHVTEESAWHSIPEHGTVAEEKARETALWSQVLSERDTQTQLRRLGVFFHYQQDTWAHRHHRSSGGLLLENPSPTDYDPYTTPLGHAADGHKPDRTPFGPITALRSFEETASYARQFVALRHGTVPAIWNGYTPAKGAYVSPSELSGDWKKWHGPYFNKLAPDDSTPAHRLVTDLLRAQASAYTADLNSGPAYLPYYTPKEADYATVRANMLVAWAQNNVGFDLAIPATRDQVTWLTTPHLQSPSFGSGTYTITIVTADKLLAGTDANLLLSIGGAKGRVDEVRLNPLISGNAFERGATNTVVLRDYVDVGSEGVVITLRSDDSGPGSGWLPSSIRVDGPGFSRVYTNGKNAWVEKGHLTISF